MSSTPPTPGSASSPGTTITKVRGQFNDFAGEATIDVENPAASAASVTIQVASVDTRNEQRDGHLRTNDFFEAETYRRSPSPPPMSPATGTSGA